VLVDHYHCDNSYQSELQSNGLKWGQFDYKRSGRYLGNFIVNIGPGRSVSDYMHCELSDNLEVLAGLNYAVIKPELSENPVPKVDKNSVLISFGASNTPDWLAECIDRLCLSPEVNHIHLLTTSLNPKLKGLLSRSFSSKFSLHYDVENIQQVLLECSYGVITCGTLSYELSAIGLPFAAGYLAENQRVLLESWMTQGLVESLGDFAQLDIDDLVDFIKVKLSKHEQLMAQQNRLKLAVDGKGASRIAEKLIELL
jgi:spore coat polysaccharide biosynthesis predicted glycosyltransferase SpsG